MRQLVGYQSYLFNAIIVIFFSLGNLLIPLPEIRGKQNSDCKEF